MDGILIQLRRMTAPQNGSILRTDGTFAQSSYYSDWPMQKTSAVNDDTQSRKYSDTTCVDDGRCRLPGVVNVPKSGFMRLGYFRQCRPPPR